MNTTVYSNVATGKIMQEINFCGGNPLKKVSDIQSANSHF